MAPALIDRKRVESDLEYCLAMRRRCQTDILFLGRVLGYSKLLDRVHGPVAEFCVKKNPDVPIEEQDKLKDRLHLDPRGTYKSTISIIDSVQWIICFPNIRICKLTATKPLATAIVGEIGGHFVKPEIADPTDFQLLFPEFCIPPKDVKVGTFTAPNRTRNWREATVMSFSIETTISGWHFDVFDPDDVVDTQNSKTPQSIEQVKRNYRTNHKTLMPWGYTNAKGTRYGPFELWGDMITKAKPATMRILVRSALRLISGERLMPGEFPAENEVELLFPELLSYEFLKKEFEDDYESFMTQYMNDAHGGKEVTFPKELMAQATISAENIPISGDTHIAWRFAYNGKPSMKDVGASVGIVEKGRLIIVDALTGTFAPSALAHQVVALAKKHGAHRVSIELTPGASYLDSAIQNYALTSNWQLNINWVDYLEDDAVRALRIKALEPMISTNRVLFSDAIGCLSEVYEQFCNFGMLDENELPDTVARIAGTLPRLVSPEQVEAEQSQAWEKAKEQDLYDRTHGIGRYGIPDAIVEEKPYTPPSNPFGLDDIMPGING